MDALPPLIQDRLDEVRELCGKYHVRKLTIFGSAVKGTFDAEKSDLDFVVDFFSDAPGRGFDHAYFRLNEDLQSLFRREVDLVERRAIRNPYFVQVLELTERAIYEADRAA